MIFFLLSRLFDFLTKFFHIAVCYRNGEGVKKDMNKVIQYFEQAADLKHPEAIFSLGICYQNGVEVNKDLNKENQLIKEAKELGCNLSI